MSLVLGADLGVAHYPDHAPTAELLLQRADAATYRARQEGSGIEVYASETDPYAPRRLALAADLSEALERDEVDVYVQPKVSLADGFVVGAEALVRWTHPRLGPARRPISSSRRPSTPASSASSRPTWCAMRWRSAGHGATPGSISTSP